MAPGLPTSRTGLPAASASRRLGRTRHVAWHGTKRSRGGCPRNRIQIERRRCRRRRREWSTPAPTPRARRASKRRQRRISANASGTQRVLRRGACLASTKPTDDGVSTALFVRQVLGTTSRDRETFNTLCESVDIACCSTPATLRPWPDVLGSSHMASARRRRGVSSDTPRSTHPFSAKLTL